MKIKFLKGTYYDSFKQERKNIYIYLDTNGKFYFKYKKGNKTYNYIKKLENCEDNNTWQTLNLTYNLVGDRLIICKLSFCSWIKWNIFKKIDINSIIYIIIGTIIGYLMNLL